MLRYALVDGQKSPPSSGGRGTCPNCGGGVIAKCGEIYAHHWAHHAQQDCDPWFEYVGPWHLGWQSLVREEFVEVPRGPHRADIQTDSGLVIELQHSPISVGEIHEREDFYGDMIWVFDATERFAALTSGPRGFFSLQQTTHVKACRRPVFLDFGQRLVEVECFTKLLHGFCGFGLWRERAEFSDRFLANCRKPGAEVSPRGGDERELHCGWQRVQPWSGTSFPSKWRDPTVGQESLLPANTAYVPLDDVATTVRLTRKAPRSVAAQIIGAYPELANGWTEPDLREMLQLLAGSPMLLMGSLRVMPAPAEWIRPRHSAAVVGRWLEKARRHSDAGRIPILRGETERLLLDKARQFERERSAGAVERAEGDVNWRNGGSQR